MGKFVFVCLLMRDVSLKTNDSLYKTDLNFHSFCPWKKVCIIQGKHIILKAFTRTKQHFMPTLNFLCLVLVG